MYDITNDVKQDFFSVIYKLRQLTNIPLSVIDKSPEYITPPVEVDSENVNYLWSVDLSPNQSKSDYKHFTSDTYVYCLICYFNLEIWKGEPSRGSVYLLFSGSRSGYNTAFNANYKYRVAHINNVLSKHYVCGTLQSQFIPLSSRLMDEDYAELSMNLRRAYDRVRLLDNL
jgi:hypothetical protein